MQYPDPYPSGPMTTYTTSYSVDAACPQSPTSNCFPMEKFARDNGATVLDYGMRPHKCRAVGEATTAWTATQREGIRLLSLGQLAGTSASLLYPQLVELAVAYVAAEARDLGQEDHPQAPS